MERVHLDFVDKTSRKFQNAEAIQKAKF